MPSYSTCKDKNQILLSEETVQFSCPMSTDGCLIHCHTKIPVTPLLIRKVPVLPESDQSCGVPVYGTMVHNEPVVYGSRQCAKMAASCN